MGCKVDNNEVWDAVKSGAIKGFSIDGYFHAEPEKQEEEKQTIDSLDELFDWLESLK